MKDSKLSYQIKGATIASEITTKGSSHEELIGGMASAIKMFAITGDLHDRGVSNDSSEFQTIFEEVDEISNAIITGFDDKYDECRTNIILASLANAIIDIALSKARHENKEEDVHKCHADCEIVDVCPKGRMLFPNAKSGVKKEVTADKDEPKKEKEHSKTNNFQKLQDAISKGDAVTAMELISNMLIKK